jgi:uncharacterized protein (DUF302 family)
MATRSPANDNGGTTMPIPRPWAVLASFVAVCAAVLGGVFAFGGFATHRQEEREMNTTRISVDHVRRTTDKPFEEVTTAFERQLGRFEPGVYQTLAAGGNTEGARAKIEAMTGPSGFMLFGTQDHGALLRLAGQKRKAMQYVIGNPLFALQMTQHDIRAGLYAPLRVLIYENEEGKTCVEYDKPSSLFGQFGNERISPTAAMLDEKLDVLVAGAFK